MRHHKSPNENFSDDEFQGEQTHLPADSRPDYGRNEILCNVYREEERIPSVREYAATVEVNANTMVRSYDYLQNQEIIYNKRGIGYFVAGNAREKIIALRKESFLNESLPEMFRQMQLLDIPVSEISALYQQFLKGNK